MSKLIQWQDLGCLDYVQAWNLQEKLREDRIQDGIPDRLLLLEHPPVFTMGKRDCEDDFVTSEKSIKAEGIDIVKCNRGGRVTYHGPGQLVCYFIFDIKKLGLGVKEFVNRVEQVCVDVLSSYGIDAKRDEEHPGLWIGRNKIVAVGLNISNDVSIHGFAINVECNMNHYRHIVACGIKNRGVTSIKQLLDHAPSMDEIKTKTIETAGRIFDSKITQFKPR